MQGKLTDKRATADLNKRIRLGEFSETVLINYSGSDKAFWNHLAIAPKIFGGQYHLGILKVLGKPFQLLEAEVSMFIVYLQLFVSCTSVCCH
jgi:hypothetical protein